ncbi:hypothetical protein [Synechococcus sp. CBW1006]|uniref:hypothetical protein n=1 Tax=Synechococcus sp. CBW1006 TaxID=1353138 RepID=UPI0018CF571C|nr:hypothetical protein [Synechococcus sp. CBW1006]QPN65838.1 hypothetical protein H8F26_13170 [Synechococcus sp. CBW1006]
MHDVSVQSLATAQTRWSEVADAECNHNIVFSQYIEDFPHDIDLAIISTTAEFRPEVVNLISSKFRPRYWILEKVLAQSIDGLKRIKDSVSGDSQCWVNTHRRAVPWHQNFKQHIFTGSPLTLEVEGGPWGLACNTIHFLDLLSWLSSEELISLDTSGLSDEWHSAKRKGNWEIFGTIQAIFARGSRAIITSSANGRPMYTYQITDKMTCWRVDEENGSISNALGFSLPGKMPLQSEMTSSLVDNILVHGICELPTLEVSVDLHTVFLKSMITHWNASHRSQDQIVPIT